MFTLTFPNTLLAIRFCRWFDKEIGTDREVDPSTWDNPTTTVTVVDIQTDREADRIITAARRLDGKTALELV